MTLVRIPSRHFADQALRVLVVEDEESYREALQAGLKNEGFEIELAEDGTEGLRRFIEHPRHRAAWI